MEPVQQDRSVTTQCARHFLHRLDLAPYRPGTPLIEKLARPNRTAVHPEPLKVLSHQYALTHRRFVVSSSLIFTACFSLRFSRRLSRHHLECLSTSSLPWLFS